jgi:hypothetical protein
MKLDAFNATGASFTYDLNDTSTWHIFYIAIGGTDIANVKAGEFLPNTTTGNQTVTDPGFEPDIVFFLTGASPNNPATSTPHLVYSWGGATESTQQFVTSIAAVDGLTTTSSARYYRDDNSTCIHLFTEGAVTDDARASFVGFTPTGFTINWVDAPASQDPIYYLAIKGGAWKIGHFSQPTVTGNSAVTGIPFTPKGLILSSTGDTTRTTSTTHAKLAIGAADSSTSMWSTTHGDENAVASSSNSMRGHLVGSTAALRMGTIAATPSAATDVDASADFVSFNAGTGFTLNWTVADASVRKIAYVVTGDTQLVSKVVTENVGLTESALRIIQKIRAATENVGLTESMALAKGKTRLVTENMGLTETPLSRRGRVRLTTEVVGLTDAAIKKLSTPIVTLSASSLKLRYSGGAANSSSILSKGGAISSVEVTNNTLNAAWDDISAAQTTSGVTEYRCFYLLNSDATLTAFNVEMWIDSNSPAGDSIEIACGSAAISAQEQGPLSLETTAPTGVSFSTAPDQDSAIPLGDIPPSGYRSFWIKRVVPAGTSSWNDNTYVLRVSFVSNHL